MISGITQQTIDTPDGAAAVVLSPHGELDLASIASLDSAVTSALRAAGPQPRLIVDLSDVSLLQPVVVGVLLEARRRCRNAGGATVLVVTAPEISATLADVEVAPLFPTAPELHAAVQRVSDR
ncbi:STAS domain-containing protein [Candidatus Poriferisodalis sp.]|uniref:STAS domain-containing protein n=1 Tax=Candidatus Poriferisodalis sp. TaxID=3101277 RepID=UPI003B02503F